MHQVEYSLNIQLHQKINWYPEIPTFVLEIKIIDKTNKITCTRLSILKSQKRPKVMRDIVHECKFLQRE